MDDKFKLPGYDQQQAGGQFTISNKEAYTLRDWFAVMSLQAIYKHHTKLTDLAAKLAYEQADEMLKARHDRP